MVFKKENIYIYIYLKTLKIQLNRPSHPNILQQMTIINSLSREVIFLVAVVSLFVFFRSVSNFIKKRL